MSYLSKFKEYPLTYLLIILNITIFLTPILIPSLENFIYQEGALSGYWVVVKGEIYRLVSSIFLHSGGTHIVMNMLSLYMVGRVVERLFSKFAYLSIYFISAFFGAFTSIYMHPDGWAVGASGAIFGVFGALAGFAFVHRNRMREQFMAFMKDFGVILLINLVIGFLFPSIDVSAHVGGLVAGVIGGLVVAKQPRFVWVYLAISVSLLVAIYNYLSLLYVSIV